MRLARIVCLLAVGLTPIAGRADDTALSKVSAEVAYFSTSLKLSDQWERFTRSKAYAKLVELPAMKLAWSKMTEELSKPGEPLDMLNQLLKDPANQELAGLLRELVRREFFLAGGEGWNEFIELAVKLNMQMQFGPMFAILSGQAAGRDPSELQGKLVLDALSEKSDELQIPQILIGFRLADSGPANKQIQRLENYLTKNLGDSPILRGRVSRKNIGTDSALIIKLDGEQVPWDEIPFEDLADEKGQYDELVKKLKSLKLVVTLVSRDGYLLLGIGPDTKAVEGFGQGPALASRDELKTLAKHAGKTLLAVSYTSQKLAAAAATTPSDLQNAADSVRDMLNEAPISDDRKKAIGDDIEALLKEYANSLPVPAAALELVFLTDRGQETFGYVFDKEEMKPAPLKLLNHVGGSPLFMAIGQVPSALPTYQAIVRWVKIFARHGESVMEDLAPDFFVQQYRDAMEAAKPYLERFDNLNSMMLGALGDGEAALVLDAKWSSKNWFPELDQKGKSLPMIEVGIVRSVTDTAALTKSFVGYRKLVNDLLDLARGTGAPVPDDGWPKPETKSVGGGTAYFWPLPPMGQDERIVPNLAIGNGAFAASLSLDHAGRLLRATPFQTDSPLLTADRPILAASHLNLAGLTRVSRTWIDLFGFPALEEMAEEFPDELRGDKAVEQFKTVLDVLACLQSVTTVTYREDGKTVTHTEVVIGDLK